MTSILEWPQRGESFRWDLYDNDDNQLGLLMVSTKSPPQITNDATRSIRRTVPRITIPPRPLVDQDATHYYADDIDPLTMVVKAHMVFGDGSEYPLGVFVWGDDSSAQSSHGITRVGSLTDLCTILDQPLDDSIGFSANTSVYTAITDLLEAQNIATDGIEETDETLGIAVGWVAGRDTLLTVFDGLGKSVGFLPPYFNNSGLLTMRSAPDFSNAEPDFVYGAGDSVIPGSALFSNDLLTAPNRYVAVGNKVDAELVGIYDIPDAAPNSFANIGRYRRKTETVQGIETQAQADAAAAALYASDVSTYSWLSFETVRIDPRHDTWNVVRYDDVQYREVAWTMTCKVGGTMSHSLRGTYSA